MAAAVGTPAFNGRGSHARSEELSDWLAVSPATRNRDIGAFVALGALCTDRRQLGFTEKEKAMIT
jgi:hypothetical protein